MTASDEAAASLDAAEDAAEEATEEAAEDAEDDETPRMFFIQEGRQLPSVALPEGVQPVSASHAAVRPE